MLLEASDLPMKKQFLLQLSVMLEEDLLKQELIDMTCDKSATVAVEMKTFGNYWASKIASLPKGFRKHGFFPVTSQ